ncbi:MAG: ferritin-like domain-containing protein [Rhodobiaceae bacterium]|nr:ferritin-like domain-containing protein [Rhodobiaceae bacterium]MCC0056973.1 ferritin-like domain-containing protein [Rhodobiaceae bacterium]
MSIKTLEDLFLHTLKDIYFAEKHITKALPKMIGKAENAELKKLFEDHLEETKGHVERLEKAFDKLGKKASGEECPAIEGITAEAEELIKEIGDSATRDAAMASAAQAVEHYEITRYGTLITWAKRLGHDDVADLLSKTLKEEESADSKLSKVAISSLNKKAA